MALDLEGRLLRSCACLAARRPPSSEPRASRGPAVRLACLHAGLRGLVDLLSGARGLASPLVGDFGPLPPRGMSIRGRGGLRTPLRTI